MTRALRAALALLAGPLLGHAACTAGPVTPPPAAPPTAAGSSTPAAGFAMHHVDKDGDGKVSLQEYREAAQRKFHELDRDGSGKIHVESECKPLFITFCKRADKNRDGLIDDKEFLDHAEEHFHGADKDKDKHLTHQELQGVQVLHW